MLGIKLYGGQYAKAGQHHLPPERHEVARGQERGVGRDWTIFSLVEGTVKFDQGGRRINVVPLARKRGPGLSPSAWTDQARQDRSRCSSIG